jgi:hypothetical protein
MNLRRLDDLILACLSDDLLKPKYRNIKSACPAVAGHCYVASETAFYLLGGKSNGWKPMHMQHEGISHWFLQHQSGKIYDPTMLQFVRKPDYTKARGMAFLTKKPSKRAKILIDRIKQLNKEEINAFIHSSQF